MSNYLVTGVAGFIGFHVCRRLLSEGAAVVGVDNLNDYYDVRLKQARLELLQEQAGFEFVLDDLAERDCIDRILSRAGSDVIIHLAAQAGVRYSLENPHAYVDSNLVAFMNLLEGCRHHGIGHLVYASSSSVYGANSNTPFSVRQNVDHPVSLYAATKKANELMAHSYSHLFRLPTTGLRLFTVYGPWGRPDMALFRFTKAILEGQPIDVFNYGRMKRDFTYVDDVVEGIVRVVQHVAGPDPAWNSNEPSPASSSAPYRVYNLGNHEPVELGHFIDVLEACVGRRAIRNLLPMQPGDVVETYADVDELQRAVGFHPATPIEVGIEQFVRWYRDYYHV